MIGFLRPTLDPEPCPLSNVVSGGGRRVEIWQFGKRRIRRSWPGPQELPDPMSIAFRRVVLRVRHLRSMEEHMNVLVATDGSDSAIEAARRSMDLLRPEMHVVLLAVIPEFQDPMEDAGGIEGPVTSYEEAQKDWEQANADGKAAIDRTAAALGTDVEVRLVADDGKAGAAIVRVADELKAGVLVVGSSNRSWLSRIFGGSVSDYVAHHAPCPVMLIPHEGD